MNFDAAPNGRHRQAETPPERALDVLPDLEDVLLEGLSDGPSSSSEEFDAADLPEPVGTPERAVRAPEASANGVDADFETLVLAALPDAAPVSSDDPGETEPPENADPPTDAIPVRAESPLEMDFDLGDVPWEGLSDNTGALGLSDASPPATSPGASSLKSGAANPGVAGDFASALLDGLLDSPGSLPDDPPPIDLADVSAFAADLPEIDAGRGAPEPEAAAHERVPEGPVAALAFAADPETEDALREGLLHFEGAAADCDDPQVWPGGLRAAVEALADGHSTGLVIVDIDGISYPSGAIHELAEVCEIGTAVIAVGSNDTARFGREILLAGVSEYLVKPLTAQAVREAAGRAVASHGEVPARGHVAGFAGTGGSGATTLAVATALHAAETGRYVSVLDLNRTVPVAALLLDVQPAAGLDQVIEAAGDGPLDAKMLDGVRTRRSERLSIYAYRWSPVLPASPSASGLAGLLDELRARSQLVLVDGMDNPRTQFALLSQVDVPVLVAEPTANGADRVARMLERLHRDASVVAVRNRTRAFKPDAAAGSLLDAGVETAPEISIPYVPTLSEIADRGWPRGRLPRRLRKPVATLLDRILASARLARAAPLREAA